MEPMSREAGVTGPFLENEVPKGKRCGWSKCRKCQTEENEFLFCRQDGTSRGTSKLGNLQTSNLPAGPHG